MRECSIDPSVGDIEELDEMFELRRDTEEYDLFELHLWDENE